MTENEAIKHIQSNICILDIMIEFDKGFDPKADISRFLERKTVYEMAITALEEIQQYREIGTVEECKEASEKRKGMQVNEIHVDKYICPSCGAENTNRDLGCPGDYYCPECGQAIYW